jgi:hypothetical protein
MAWFGPNVVEIMIEQSHVLFDILGDTKEIVKGTT